MQRVINLMRQIEEFENLIKGIDLKVDEIDEKIIEMNRKKNTLNKKRDQLSFEIESMRGKAREIKLVHFDSLLETFSDQTRVLRGLKFVEEAKQSEGLLTALQLFEKLINYKKMVKQEQLSEVTRFKVVVEEIDFAGILTYLDENFELENIVIEFNQESGELYLDIARIKTEEGFVCDIVETMKDYMKQFGIEVEVCEPDEECVVEDCIEEIPIKEEEEEEAVNMCKILAINTSFIDEGNKLDELIESTEIIDSVNLDGKTLYCFRDLSKERPACYEELLKVFVSEVMKNTIIPKDKMNDENIIATVVQLF